MKKIIFKLKDLDTIFSENLSPLDFHGKKDRKVKSLSERQTVRELLVILSVHTVAVKSDIISDVSSRRIAKPQRRQSNLQKHSRPSQ